MTFKHIGAASILTAMILGVFGFLGVMTISNSNAISTIRERERGLAREVHLMRQDFNSRLDKIDRKLDNIITK